MADQNPIVQQLLFKDPPKKTRPGRWALTGERVVEAVRRYRAGEGMMPLARDFGVSYSCIRDLLIRQGILLRSIEQGRKIIVAGGGHIHRKYDVNQGYFAEIDTPAKARWLGFIASDGCVSVKPDKAKQFIVQIQERDRGHLESLASSIGYAGPISAVRRGPHTQARLCISSTKMCNDLSRHGIKPRKSLTLEPWAGPEALQRFWWAGMLDGDGTLVQTSAGERRWSVSLCSGSRPVIEGWVAFVRAVAGCDAAVKVDKRGTFACGYSGVRVPQTMARILYDDLQGSVPLARKKEAADNLLALNVRGEYRSPFRWPASVSLTELDASHAILGSWEAVAKKYGCELKSVKHRLDYLRKINNLSMQQS